MLCIKVILTTPVANILGDILVERMQFTGLLSIARAGGPIDLFVALRRPNSQLIAMRTTVGS